MHGSRAGDTARRRVGNELLERDRNLRMIVGAVGAVERALDHHKRLTRRQIVPTIPVRDRLARRRGASPSARWPSARGLADLPFVAERVNDAAQAPAVLIHDRGCFRRPGVYCSLEHGFGVVDDEQGPACRSVDRSGAQPLHGRAGRPQPERCIADRQLRHDVVALAYPVHDRRCERRLVERHGGCGAVHLELWLKARHPAALNSANTSLASSLRWKIRP